ncbi:fatty acid desaturase [Desulfobulbus sp. AH-315-M07]|nr:fatty acid desaturase [Desulfobulbus sp. AH-315-M07]
MAEARRRLEIPTVLIAVAIYGGWLALTYGYRHLPFWLTALLGGWLIAWHGSLQHETVHGHPTRSRFLNSLIGGIPLGLWLPYGLYRESHLSHHTSDLTSPSDDPESYFVSRTDWAQAGGVRRAFFWFHATLIGRLVVGPLRAVASVITEEAALVRRGDRSHARHFAVHFAGVALVLSWVVGVCGMPWWVYLAAFAYPGLSLTLLRSYAEHRAVPKLSQRTAIVDAGAVMSLLYLNNNLHALHHERPAEAWYHLPAIHARERERLLADNGGYYFSGYLAVARRCFLDPGVGPVHPHERSLSVEKR